MSLRSDRWVRGDDEVAPEPGMDCSPKPPTELPGASRLISCSEMTIFCVAATESRKPFRSDR